MGHHAGPGGMGMGMYQTAGGSYGPDGGPGAGMPPGGGAYLPGGEQAHFYPNVVSLKD